MLGFKGKEYPYRLMKCKLCRQEKKLLNSHIIPEFFYKYTYSSSHKISVVSTGKISKEFLNLQKGLKERLLCADCEQLLSPWEKYVREAIFGGTPLKGMSDNRLIKIEGLDYRTFKLFGLSLIWRASVSTNRFFENIDLGSHEEVIRKKLLQNEPGEENEYAIVLSAVKLENAPIKDLVMRPEELSDGGFTYLRFFLGSFIWLFVISKDASAFRLNDFYLKRNGTILIPKKDAEKTELFQEFSKRIFSQGEIKDHHKND